MKIHKTILNIAIACIVAMGPLQGFAQLKADFSADNIKGCSPVVVNFTDLSTGNPASYKWDFGNGTTSSEKNPGIIYIAPGAYNIKLVISNGNEKDSVEKKAFINIYGLPVVDFSATNTSGCSPLKVQFSNNSNPNSGSISEVVWDFGDGTISKDPNPSHVYTGSDSFNVTLSVINSYGCKQSATKTDLVKIPPTVKSEFAYNYTNVCQPPAQVDFENLSLSNSELNYQWDFGDGSVSNSTNPSHTFNTGGDYIIRLISITKEGCADTSIQDIAIGSVVADFTATDSVCTNQPVIFKNHSNPVPGNVTWSFGDGTSSEDNNPVHSYAAPGVYTVVLNADFGSCAGTATRVVTVTNKPKAAFSVSGNNASCSLPLSINFNNTSTGASGYKWIFGDGQTSSLANPTHDYNAAGSYTVSLVTFNTNGCSDTITYKDLIKSGHPQITGFKDLPARGCVPTTVPFSAEINSAGPITSYKWNFGDGTGSSEASPVHVYNALGSYDVTLTVNEGTACAASFTYKKGVEIGSVPQADFNAQPRQVCSSLPVSFFDKSSSDVNEWLWFFGDGGSSSQRNPDHIYRDTGYFTVTLIAKNNNCTDTLVFTDYVQIYPPIAKFDTKIVCDKPYVRTFINKSVGAKTWSWEFGDGTTSTDLSPVHVYAKTGWYNVRLTVTNGTCINYMNDSVYIIDETPVLNYKPAKPVCRNDSVTLMVSAYDPLNYRSLTWKFGNDSNVVKGPDTTTVKYKYLKAATVYPQVIFKDLNGCLDSTASNIKIAVYGPTAAFSSVAGSCLNTTIIFKDNSASDGLHPISNFQWSYGDGALENKSSGPFQHSYSGAGYYNVSLKVTDSYGCTDSVIKSKAIRITRPVASFKVNDSITCASNLITFRNTSVAVGLKASWTFGDGTSSQLVRPSHKYLSPGVYTVNLVITDTYGCRDSIKKPNFITIANPQASFTLNDTIGQCPPLLTEPQNTSSNYQSLTWHFGDDQTSGIANPQHYYNEAGTYIMKLIVKGNGNCYDTATKKILLKGPSGNLNYSTLAGCAPTNVGFSSTSKNVVEYIWDFNNGVVKHTADSAIQYNYTQYGSYLPKLVLVDSAGCKVSVENKDRIVISDLNAGIKMLPPGKIYCDSTLRIFKDSSVVYYDSVISYHWDFGDNSTSDAKNPSHFYGQAGTYNVKLTINTKQGCKDQAAMPLTIDVNKSPIVEVNVKDSVCENLPVKFFSVSQQQNSNLSWSWNLGDGSVAAIQSPEHVYAGGGNFKATLKVTDALGCFTSKAVPVHVYSNPVVNAGPDTTICNGSNVVLQPSGASYYKWSADATLSCLNCSQPSAKPLQVTRYYTTGFTANGCSARDSVLVKVTQPFNMVVENGATLCLGQSYTLKASGADKYEWSPKQYLDNPYSATPKFSPATPSNVTFTVTGKDAKNCFTDTGNVFMKVYPVPTITITNKNLVANAGYPVKLETSSSTDVIHWKWTPVAGLDNPYLEEPTLTPGKSGTYTVVATNEGGCTASDQLTIAVLCDGRNIFIPNTFSPNNDGMNDRFYPHGKGILTIRSLQIFNRWGQIVFEKVNFPANNLTEGWDGTFKGQPQGVDVYVYVMEVVCDNGTLNKINGNVTLLR